MKQWLAIVAAAGTVLAAGVIRAADAPVFQDLFSGKDLTGWVNVNTAPDTWHVENGMLVCSGQPIAFLCGWARGDIMIFYHGGYHPIQK